MKMQKMKCVKPLIISEEEGQAFALLSGDFNPLHVDPLYARRLQFGGMVVHGVHHMLRAWNMVVDELIPLHNRALTSIRVRLPGPVKYNEEITVSVTIAQEGHRAQIVGNTPERQCLVLDLVFAEEEGFTGNADDLNVMDGPARRQDIIDQTFPPRIDSGYYPLFCDLGTAERLFPALLSVLPLSLLAQIMACTQIVGMTCPGLHSVFTGLTLLVKPADNSEKSAQLNFYVAKSDPRFSRAKIAIDGPHIKGELDTFFRAPPVAQPKYDEISADYTGQEFLKQRALVIGGSRGIGETTAKILAAGGAEVTITYFKGEDEALGLCKEIAKGSGICTARQLDVLSAGEGDFIKLVDEVGATHIYYFATPKIESHIGDTWDQQAYERYCDYYIHPLGRLVKGFMASNPDYKINLYYPSSIYVDEPRPGFGEYAAAKEAGETLCQQLGHQFPSLRVQTPRLPTMMTDQTSSIIPIKADAVKDVMRAELKRVASTL